jgi:CheY-like chemotaxis protein
MCFDVIVSDIGLPQVDGYELIGRLRQLAHLSAVPALALTGYASTKDATAALGAGFDLHVAKPVDPATLAGALERLLKSRPPAAPKSEP